MHDVMMIGRFQVENLLNQQVKFLYFDLRSPAAREAQGSNHRLLAGSKPMEPEAVLPYLRSIAASHDAPIILFSELTSQEMKSVAIARQLGENSFLNVYAIDGGSESLL